MHPGQVVKDSRQHLVSRIQEGHTALGQLLHVLGFEYGIPGVDAVDTQYFFDFIDVVANPVGAPQVRHGVLVARIVGLQALEQGRVEVGIVRQLRKVEFLERTRLDLLAQEVVRRNDHVITGTPG